MQTRSDITAALALAASLLLAACHEGPDADATDPSQPALTVAAAPHAQAAGSPRERAVLAAMEQYKQAFSSVTLPSSPGSGPRTTPLSIRRVRW